METIFTIISFVFIIGLLLVPFLLYNFIYKSGIKFKFSFYIVSALIVTITIVFIFSWWSYTSDHLLLKHYGFNADGMNDAEFYAKVLPEDLDSVKSLEAGIMGIGWPLKAIIIFVCYSPYLFIVYFFSALLAKRMLKIQTT